MNSPEAGSDQQPSGEDRPALAAFAEALPAHRRRLFEHQASGSGGRRLATAVATQLRQGTDLAGLVRQALSDPQPDLVHNWPAFFASRIEGLAPSPGLERHDITDVTRRAEIDAEMAARRAAAAAADSALAVARVEADAISGVIPDRLLEAIVARVTPGLPGPLGRSALALTRGVVAFCREAYANQPGDLSVAVDVALSTEVGPGNNQGGPWPAVPLPHPLPETPSLHDRIRILLQHWEDGSADTP